MVNRAAIALAFACLLGMLIGAFTASHFGGVRAAGKENDLTDFGGSHRLTNPLLACGDINDLSVGAMETLRATINGVIDTAMKGADVTHAAVS